MCNFCFAFARFSSTVGAVIGSAKSSLNSVAISTAGLLSTIGVAVSFGLKVNSKGAIVAVFVSSTGAGASKKKSAVGFVSFEWSTQG